MLVYNIKCYVLKHKFVDQLTYEIIQNQITILLNGTVKTL